MSLKVAMAARQIPKPPEHMAPSIIYDEGYSAALAGDSNNPYFFNTANHRMWEMGQLQYLNELRDEARFS